MKRKLLKTVLLNTLPVMAGYLAIGIGFGILLKVNGYGLWWAIGMSVFIYAGAMQYVGVTLLSGGASLLTVGLTTLIVNARHLFYGITMIDRYKGSGLKKPYLMHALTDETYSLVCSDIVPEGARPHIYYLLISAFDHIYWIIGSILGVLAGSVIPFDTTGIDFAMTALFVTVFVAVYVEDLQADDPDLCPDCACIPFVHPIPFPEDPPHVQKAGEEIRRTERICGRNAHRLPYHFRLWPAGSDLLPF